MNKWQTRILHNDAVLGASPGAVEAKGRTGSCGPDQKFEPNIRLANLRAKINVLAGKAVNLNFAAFTDLIDEAKFNRASVLDAKQCAVELAALLQTRDAALRAAIVRQITEFGRYIELPNWHTSERHHLLAWYHCMQRLRLVDFANGDTVVTEGVAGSCAYWCLTGDAQLSSSLAPGASEALQAWDMVGADALQDRNYDCTVKAAGPLQCASLSRSDYQAVLALLQQESAQELRQKHLMLLPRGTRSTANLRDLAAALCVTELISGMEPDVRLQVSELVEYMQLPEGFIIFDENDRVDFCYLVLQGQVSFSRATEGSRRREDLGIKLPGDHFGTLMTLSQADRKRTFTAKADTSVELAIISRIAYNRILTKQLQASLDARAGLLGSLKWFGSSPDVLQKAALSCQDEAAPPGTTIVEPTSGPPSNKLYLILEGECKLQWVTDKADQLPPPMTQLVTKVCGRRTTLGGQGSQAPSAAGPSVPRKASVLEIARLGKGDLINGILLHHRSVLFRVVSVTAVKLISLEVNQLELSFGKEASQALRAIALNQTKGYLARVATMLNVRQNVITGLMNISPDLSESQMGPFIDHYIAHSASAHAPSTTGSTSLKHISDVPLATILAPSVHSLAEDPPSPQLVERGRNSPAPDAEYILSGRYIPKPLTHVQQQAADAGRPIPSSSMLPARRRRLNSTAAAAATAAVTSAADGGKAPADLGMQDFAGSFGMSMLDASTAVRTRSSAVSPWPTSHSSACGGAVGYSSAAFYSSSSGHGGPLEVDPSFADGSALRDPQHQRVITSSRSLFAELASLGTVDAASRTTGANCNLPASATASASAADDLCAPQQSLGSSSQMGSSAAFATSQGAGTASKEGSVQRCEDDSSHAATVMGLAARRVRNLSPFRPLHATQVELPAAVTVSNVPELVWAGDRSSLNAPLDIHDKEVCNVLTAPSHTHITTAASHLPSPLPSAACDIMPGSSGETTSSSQGIASSSHSFSSSPHPTAPGYSLPADASSLSSSSSPSFLQLGPLLGPHRSHSISPALRHAGAGGRGLESPVMSSPTMSQAMLVQRSGSPMTAKFSADRAATLVSGVLQADGSVAATSTAAATPRRDMVVILPKMLSVYESVINPESSPIRSKLDQRTTPSPGADLPYSSWGGSGGGSFDNYSPLPGPKPLFKMSMQHMPEPTADGGVSVQVRTVTGGSNNGGAEGVAARTGHSPSPSSHHDGRSSPNQHMRHHQGQVRRGGVWEAAPAPMSLRVVAGVDGPRVNSRHHKHLHIGSKELGRDEPILPLEVDRAAPAMSDHPLNNPSLNDINYLLHRWGDRWAKERDVTHAKYKVAQHLPAGLSANGNLLTEATVMLKAPLNVLGDGSEQQQRLVTLAAITAEARRVVASDETLRFSRTMAPLAQYGIGNSLAIRPGADVPIVRGSHSQIVFH